MKQIHKTLNAFCFLVFWIRAQNALSMLKSGQIFNNFLSNLGWFLRLWVNDGWHKLKSRADGTKTCHFIDFSNSGHSLLIYRSKQKYYMDVIIFVNKRGKHIYYFLKKKLSLHFEKKVWRLGEWSLTAFRSFSSLYYFSQVFMSSRTDNVTSIVPNLVFCYNHHVRLQALLDSDWEIILNLKDAKSK